jgi:hypothetical protein
VLVSYLPHLNHLSLGQRPVTDYTPLHGDGHRRSEAAVYHKE